MLRPLSLLSPRARSYGSGPNAFQVNRTAAAAGIHPSETGADLELELAGAGGDRGPLTRAELLAMPLVTADLPIACVEGWSTVQRWTGVRLADLARLVGVDHPAGAHVESLERRGGVRPSLAVRPAGPGRRVPAGSAGQRRRPVPRSRLPGPDHHPGRPGGAQHQMGGADHLHGGD